MIEPFNPAASREQNLTDSRASWRQAGKRILDVLAAASGLVLFAPLFLLLAALIRLDSRGSVFYTQIRIGRGGRRFKLLKFRTMMPGAAGALPAVFSRAPRQKSDWQRYQKLSRDPRVTRLGRGLRRWSLDELPQLWNVLKGEMSLVGPRPILPEQRAAYGRPYRAYCLVRPGMTGLWQVSGRNRLTFSQRARLDARYVSNWSLKLDLQILTRTLPAVLRGEGTG